MPNEATQRSADASTKRGRKLALVLLDLDVPAGAEASTEAIVLRVAQLVRFGVEPGGVSVGEAHSMLLDDATVQTFLTMVREVAR
jgi:hypothetical protein